jgi:hypothetical protein
MSELDNLLFEFDKLLIELDKLPPDDPIPSVGDPGVLKSSTPEGAKDPAPCCECSNPDGIGIRNCGTPPPDGRPKCVKVGRNRTAILTSLRLIVQTRLNPTLMVISSSELQRAEPSLQTLKGSKSVGDSPGNHGFRLPRLRGKGPWLTGKETFDLIVENLTKCGISQEEIAVQTGFANVEAFRQFWHQRPANSDLEQASRLQQADKKIS